MHKSRMQAHDQGNVRNFSQSFYNFDENLQYSSNTEIFKDTKDLNDKIKELDKIIEKKCVVKIYLRFNIRASSNQNYKSQLESYTNFSTIQTIDLNEVKGKLKNIGKLMKDLEAVSTKWSQKWLYQWKSRGIMNNQVNDWDDSTSVELGKIAIQVKDDLATSDKVWSHFILSLN